MGRKLFIVALGNRAMYESLRRALAGEPNVEVIYDRRATDRAHRRSGGPLDLGDRRLASHVDEDLRTQGWAVVRIDP